MDKYEIIKDLCPDYGTMCNKCNANGRCTVEYAAKSLIIKNYRKVGDDEMVIKKSEYEKIKSLYDTQKGAIMTSSIGDLPLTIEGLRKAVDELARARRAEREAQELCEKYYNEAKDLRRELKKVEQKTATDILTELNDEGYKIYKKQGNTFDAGNFNWLIAYVMQKYDCESETES